MVVAVMLLPTMVYADTRGDKLLEKADSLYGIQQYKEALKVATEALLLTKGTESEADCLNLLAIINIRLSDYEEAAKYAKQCYDIDEKSGDPDVMSSSLNTLAAIYMGANQPKEAEQYVLKGIEMAEKADNPSRMAVLQAMASEGVPTVIEVNTATVNNSEGNAWYDLQGRRLNAKPATKGIYVKDGTKVVIK